MDFRKYNKGKETILPFNFVFGRRFSNIEFEKISCEFYNHFINASAAEQQEGINDWEYDI